MNVAGFEEVAGEVSGFPETIGDKGRNSQMVAGLAPGPAAGRGSSPDAGLGTKPSRVAGLPVRRRAVLVGAGSAGAPRACCPSKERPRFSTAGWKEENPAEEIIAA